MPRSHFLTRDELLTLRHRWRVGKEKLDDLATELGYSHRSNVRHAILRFEEKEGLGALVDGPTKAQTTVANPLGSH